MNHCNFFTLCLIMNLIVGFTVKAQPHFGEKYEGVKTWELEKSPLDLGYRLVPNWLQLPENIADLIPSDIAFDKAGNICILNRGNGNPSLIYVNNKGGFLRQVMLKGFKNVHYLKLDDDGSWWITDTGTHQINKINAAGEIIFSIGEKNVSGWDAKHYNKPTDIDFLHDGTCLVSDGYGNQRAALLNSDFEYIGEWGAKGSEPGKFVLPHEITIGADGNVYISDRDAWRVQIFNAKGELIAVWPHIGKIYDLLETPDHHFFCLDGVNGRITKVNQQGEIIGFFGDKELLDKAHGFAMGADTDLIVVTTAGKVLKFSKNHHE